MERVSLGAGGTAIHYGALETPEFEELVRGGCGQARLPVVASELEGHPLSRAAKRSVAFAAGEIGRVRTVVRATFTDREPVPSAFIVTPKRRASGSRPAPPQPDVRPYVGRRGSRHDLHNPSAKRSALRNESRYTARAPWNVARAGSEDGRGAGTLVALYRTVKPDVVHHVSAKHILYGGIASRIARVPAADGSERRGGGAGVRDRERE
jgi:hypothetical protein